MYRLFLLHPPTLILPRLDSQEEKKIIEALIEYVRYSDRDEVAVYIGE
jgi:hypothetical protein